ncbi:hypothetical protein [Vibrio crassostreae]|nr:hypothetical protein [Vibrio crassostreae]TCO05903.1 hypothetical protein EDB30_102487 [Vibrio crassostreae]TCT50227.1 hypothetical protein EDB42_10850 [Vibrio crassostreae]TCT63156.1 hypothetical protein EDB31_1323 [Vibrio crassostreae]TCT75325.1 hypothetical protein EDB41_108108 [Vibrio crassostreae]TCT94250.1 hypothetical protein EDB38_10950 [Vibrio crassostreae]
MYINFKKIIGPVLLISIALTMAIRNGDINKLFGINEPKSIDIISLMTQDPEVLLNADISLDIAVSTIDLVVNDDSQSNKDMLLGSHAVTRKTLISNNQVGFYMDIWENMTLELAQGVFSNLEKKYGSSIELSIPNHKKEWIKDDNGSSRILQEFEIKNRNLNVSIQIQEKQSYRKTYALIVSYTKKAI